MAEGRRTTLITSLVLLAGFAITWGIQGAMLINIDQIDTGTGTITVEISGSTTCFPVIEEAANIYMDNHPNYDIRVSSGGSSTGIKNAGLRVSDIGMSSRDIKDTENETYNFELVDWVFAADGIAIVFDDDATHGVTQLTMEQIFLIYNGTYTSWDAPSAYGVPGLGGAAIAIDVVTRAEGSGTRGSFEEIVKVNITGEYEELGDNDGYQTAVVGFTTYAENPGVAAYVASTPNAIGYIGLGFVDESPGQHYLVPVSSNGVDYYTATVDNVKSGVYPISRGLHLVTRGVPAAGTRAFIDFIYSPYGQTIVADEGFVTLY